MTRYRLGSSRYCCDYRKVARAREINSLNLFSERDTKLIRQRISLTELLEETAVNYYYYTRRVGQLAERQSSRAPENDLREHLWPRQLEDGG